MFLCVCVSGLFLKPLSGSFAHECAATLQSFPTDVFKSSRMFLTTPPHPPTCRERERTGETSLWRIKLRWICISVSFRSPASLDPPFPCWFSDSKSPGLLISPSSTPDPHSDREAEFIRVCNNLPAQRDLLHGLEKKKKKTTTQSIPNCWIVKRVTTESLVDLWIRWCHVTNFYLWACVWCYLRCQVQVLGTLGEDLAFHVLIQGKNGPLSWPLSCLG